MQKKELEMWIRSSPIKKAMAVEGQAMKVKGQTQLEIKIKNRPFSVRFHILPKMTYWAILGIDFMEKFNCKIDFSKLEVTVGTPRVSTKVCTNCVNLPRKHDVSLPMLPSEPPMAPHDLAYYNSLAT